jgi:hypothetical protein
MRRARNGGGGGWLPACRAVQVLLLSLVFKVALSSRLQGQRRVTGACSGGERRAAAWLGPPNELDSALEDGRLRLKPFSCKQSIGASRKKTRFMQSKQARSWPIHHLAIDP